MIQFRNISIKRKLTLIIMAASTFGLVLVAACLIACELFTYREEMLRDLTTLAEIIGNRSSAALTFDEKTDAEETLGSLAAKRHIAAAVLYNKEGEIFAHYPRIARESHLFPTRPRPESGYFEKDRLVIFHEIRVKGEMIGTIYVETDLQEVEARFQRYVEIVLPIFFASLLITYLLSVLLQRIISKPISHLAQTAKAISAAKDYSVRATKQGHDELGQLIDGFNEMLGQIQERDQNLERRVRERTQALQAEVAERERAEAALKQQFGRISLLNQITQAISERQDTDSILHVVLRQLEDHLNLDVGCVALFDPKEQSLNVAAFRAKNTLLKSKLALNEGTALRLTQTGLEPCRTGQTVYIPDTLKHPAALSERFAGAGLRSAVAVPLLVENNLFGVLLTGRLAPTSFSSGECEFLRTLSEHVALAAHQARLHTELETAYNDLRKTQQTVMQQERLKALGQMASGIAHDINNALSPVVGFSDLLLRGEKGLSTNGQKYLSHIRTAGEDIAHIVARLREFYRRRDENESLQQLNLNRLTDQVIDMTRPRWKDIPQSRGVTIEMHTELAGEVPDLMGIESEVREALTNLVLNAVDALPNGGNITLRTRVLAHDPSANNGTPHSSVVVEVADSGTGMTEEVRKRCLEPFFSTKGKRGTGLGLAMVYGVMERHEGRIDIDSEFGKGTTCRLTFPVREGLQASGRDDHDNSGVIPLQILCIDDEPLLRDLLKEMLERDGHAVEVSDGGQSGLEAFRSATRRGKPFDVVITDLGMPYVDGRQVARLLKQEAPAVPVVMLTGWGAFMKEEGSSPTQVDAVLSKPPRSREIRETLARLATSRKG
jgi:signal transduction histidine kinase/ActR/RegA family two-component response regulator/HAMP domain-containing protein